MYFMFNNLYNSLKGDILKEKKNDFKSIHLFQDIYMKTTQSVVFKGGVWQTGEGEKKGGGEKTGGGGEEEGWGEKKTGEGGKKKMGEEKKTGGGDNKMGRGEKKIGRGE